jgi:5-methylcytosine-specific restriction endonuclease McrA
LKPPYEDEGVWCAPTLSAVSPPQQLAKAGRFQSTNQLTTELSNWYAREEKPVLRMSSRSMGIVRCCHYPRCLNPFPCRVHPREHRPSASRRGYDRRWREYAHSFLREHPLCRMCEAEGRLTPASAVDHVIPVKGKNDPLFWIGNNHQPLCHSHHSQKTRTEMQTGRPVKSLGVSRWGPPRTFLCSVAKNENEG